jgi:hypothetical protein
MSAPHPLQATFKETFFKVLTPISFVVVNLYRPLLLSWSTFLDKFCGLLSLLVSESTGTRMRRFQLPRNLRRFGRDV